MLSRIKENKYIDRFLGSDIQLAAGINFLFLVLVLALCDLKYEVSDDFIMASILSGAFGATQNPHMIFVNTIVGYLLIPLYRLCPQVSWYFVSQIALIFLSSTAVTWFLLERLDRARAFMLSAMLILFFTNDAYILVQFTKTAMFAVMAGSLIFIWALFEKRRVRTVLSGALLCLLGTMYRFSDIYLAGGFLLLILLYEFVRLFRSGQPWRVLRERLAVIVFGGLLLIGTAFSLEQFDTHAYQKDEAYRYFSEYGKARADIVDYRDYGYEAYADRLQEIGVSENDYYMMKHWEFADNAVFSLETLQQTAQIIRSYHNGLARGRNEILGLLQDREFTKYPVCTACIILLFLGVFLNTRNWWMTLGSIGVGIIYLTYFCFRERYVYRVEYAVFLGIFLSGIYFWDRKNQDRETLETARICAIVGLICLLGNLLLYVPNNTYQDVTSETRKEYIEKTFFESSEYDAQKYRKAVNKGKPVNHLLEEIEQENDNFYFLDFGTTVQTLYYEWSPWEALPAGYFDNATYLSGVTANFPDVVELLDSKDLRNPLQALVKENVYVVDNMRIDEKLSYLREHYYPEARAELVKELDGYQIWKFYER